MSLSKKITLDIKDYVATPNTSVKFYVGDTLDLIFTINKYEINNANSLENLGFTLDGLTVELLIENSQGTDSIEATTLLKNNIVFRFTKKYTRYPGKGKMQIRLTDNDGCEVKLPEFEYEIRATINEGLDTSIPDQVVKVLGTENGKLLITEDGKLILKEG